MSSPCSSLNITAGMSRGNADALAYLRNNPQRLLGAFDSVQSRFPGLTGSMLDDVIEAAWPITGEGTSIESFADEDDTWLLHR